MRSKILLALLVSAAVDVARSDEAPAIFDPNALGDGSIGVFADPAGTERCATIQPGSFATLYVVATTGGATSDGLTGAEFRIEASNPAGWLFLFNSAPNVTITLGSAMDLAPDDPSNAIGANMAFSSCQAGPRVLFGTLVAIDQGGAQPTELRVKRRSPPANSHWPCPLFTICDVGFSKVCMGSCSTSPVGEIVTSVASINDPSCSSEANCPADCANAPCVSIAEVADRRACPGSPVTVTGTVTNCGTEPADIDIFIDYVLAASHSAVPPGAVVTGVRDVIQECGELNYDRNFVGVVARNASCPQPIGVESGQVVFCDTRYCNGNVPPDCSGAVASVATLSPPNGEFVPITIAGVTDPNGDPVQVRVTGVTSDEPNAESKECVDAWLSPTGLQLRAARSSNGNGRVYTVRFEATEPSGLRCNGSVAVCVPRKPGSGCVDDGQIYEPLHCNYFDPGFGDGLRAAPVAGAGVRITLASAPQHAGRVEIYDARGRRVAVLDESRIPRGTVDLLWDGRDSSGVRVSRGIYLIRAVVDGVSYSTKSVLLH